MQLTLDLITARDRREIGRLNPEVKKVISFKKNCNWDCLFVCIALVYLNCCTKNYAVFVLLCKNMHKG